MVINDVVQFICGDKGIKVILIVKKIDGSVKDIMIICDVVVLEEQFVKLFILEGEEGSEECIGYILLFLFYVDFQNKNGCFCFMDVVVEIEKFKVKNVDGIILDLCYNGGGFLWDVVKMIGLFIEKGLIVQVKFCILDFEVLKDFDLCVQYDGLFVVMVNFYSVFVLEILVVVLQDYGWVVIVGSFFIFGKGIVQCFIDLDCMICGFNELKLLGEIKLIIQKFYCVNGGFIQFKGVMLDIILLDNFFYIKIGECDWEYVMEWMEIDFVEYDQDVLQVDNISKLCCCSEKWIEENVVFQKILVNVKCVEQQCEEFVYLIGLEAYCEMCEKCQEQADEFDGVMDQVVLENIFNLEEDLFGIEVDEFKKVCNDEWLESVFKDIYIKEILVIMYDMIKEKQVFGLFSFGGFFIWVGKFLFFFGIGGNCLSFLYFCIFIYRIYKCELF